MRVPVSTYRLQLNPAFRFQDAHRILDYLSELGISSIYASPIFKAKRGSTHGYDVIDPTQLNPELGTGDDFDGLVRAVNERGMGWLQDIVPNHMAFDSENRMLMDVLENGNASPYFAFFDVDWHHPYETFRGKILAPFLGRFYGECLEDGEIQIEYGEAGLSVTYYDLKFPLRIESYPKVLTHNLRSLKKRLGKDHPDVVKYLGALYTLKNIPLTDESAERSDQIAFGKRLLWELYNSNNHVRDFIHENVTTFNGQKGVPESFNLLDELLADQHFRLSFWKVATEEINYRRFFNINQLISLRQEDESVFRATHALIFRLVKDGAIAGLRVDHVDGLYDPAEYLRRLREGLETYVVIEKILEPDEDICSSWTVQGTTGYDFLNHVNGIFCERKSDKAFDKIYSRFIGQRIPYNTLVSDKKRLMIGKHMAGDIDQLAHMIKSATRNNRHGSDITLYGLRRALVEVLAFFPVYRTYITGDGIDEHDRRYVADAIAEAKESIPGFTRELDFIQRFLLLDYYDYLSGDAKREWLRFVMRFQQSTGPLMAKGFEDTALYIYNRLLSLNDVGGGPDRFGISPVEFHYFNKRRAAQWPHTMNATSTHDTKRGEDLRARINVLSQIPDEWQRKLGTWSKMNAGAKHVVRGHPVPDANDEYFFYQTLLGVFPFLESEYSQMVDRIKTYIIKAVREAKVHTAWLKPDEEYEEAYTGFVEHVLRPSSENHFLNDFTPFQKKVAHYGILNSLSQTLLKITSPGVPDFYVGTELWDLNLVDPDNRRPVDFELRKRYLSEIKEREKEDMKGLIQDLLEHRTDARIKLFVTYRALQTRKRLQSLFSDGRYLPLRVAGRHRNHIVAFARHKENDWSISIAPRRFVPLCADDKLPLGKAVWEDTRVELPRGAPSTWHHRFTDGVLAADGSMTIAEVCKEFPVGLLVLEKGHSDS